MGYTIIVFQAELCEEIENESNPFERCNIFYERFREKYDEAEIMDGISYSLSVKFAHFLKEFDIPDLELFINTLESNNKDGFIFTSSECHVILSGLKKVPYCKPDHISLEELCIMHQTIGKLVCLMYQCFMEGFIVFK